MIKNIILDLDGTVYNGNSLIDSCNLTINKLLDLNYNIIFFTNNSSKSKEDYFMKLENFGINVRKNNVLFYNSTMATIQYLKQNLINNIYLVGTTSMKVEFDKHINVCNFNNKNIEAVVIGYDTELTYKKIAEASILIENGCKFISTNIDFNCPIEKNRFIPDCGSITKMIEITTNKSSFYVGKPNTLMLKYLFDTYNILKEETILVGDRIYTDIKCGNDYGIKTCLVLSGETNEDDIYKSNIKPTYTIKNLNYIKNII